MDSVVMSLCIFFMSIIVASLLYYYMPAKCKRPVHVKETFETDTATAATSTTTPTTAATAATSTTTPTTAATSTTTPTTAATSTTTPTTAATAATAATSTTTPTTATSTTDTSTSTVDTTDTLKYYQRESSLKPSGYDEYEYYNGIYCKPDDNDCRTYALTCTVGEDPNCHNNVETDTECYNSSGEYICNSSSGSASSYTDALHDASIDSGEDVWDPSVNSYTYSYSDVRDKDFKKIKGCKTVDGELICNDKVAWRSVYDDGKVKNVKAAEDIFDDDLDPAKWKNKSSKNDWGLSTVNKTLNTLFGNNMSNKNKITWSSFDYDVDDSPLLNYPLKNTDWNRYLASPNIDTKGYTDNSDTLNKIFQILYVLVSRNDCSQGIYGCCSDKVTAKTDYQGSNCPSKLSLSDEVKQYIDMSITKNAGALIPPQDSSISNLEIISKTKKNDNKTVEKININSQTNLPPNFASSFEKTNSSPQSTNAREEPISSSASLFQPVSFYDTNVLPAQASYTSTVYLAGPNGNTIGNNGPDPSFECKKGNCKQNNLPMPVLTDFSRFGM